MNRNEFQRAAKLFRAGRLSLVEFADQFLNSTTAPTAGDPAPAEATDSSNAASSIEGVTLDLDRADRCGFPEVIFGQGKSDEAIVRIADQMAGADQPLLITRIAAKVGDRLTGQFPAGCYNSIAHTFRLGQCETPGEACVAVLSAGTADSQVAEEAIETLIWAGVRTYRAFDIGVAGPQRLELHLDRIRDCQAVVVVAGMDGALPSVVGGHVAAPVIAVPTSTGYGLNLDGLSAMLTMLNTCTPNVSVVNVDGGFRAAYFASVMIRATALLHGHRNQPTASH